MKRLKKLAEGDLFRIPLRSKGVFVGIIARKGKYGACVLAYIFHAKIAISSDLSVEDFNLDDYVLFDIVDVSTLDLKSGAWPIIGALPFWKREEWPVPIFRNRLGQYSLRDDNNYQQVTGCFFNPHPAKYFRDATYGRDSLIYYIESTISDISKQTTS